MTFRQLEVLAVKSSRSERLQISMHLFSSSLVPLCMLSLAVAQIFVNKRASVVSFLKPFFSKLTNH